MVCLVAKIVTADNNTIWWDVSIDVHVRIRLVYFRLHTFMVSQIPN